MRFINFLKIDNMKKYISWRRVSTKRQGRSGLGLEAQQEIIKYFIERDNGTLLADYSEVYTGTDLNGCMELKRAIQHAKKEDAILIIAKTDRFRKVTEALKILDEMQGSIMFCDLPNTDRFTLTLFFSLAEREALITKLRVKQALEAKRHRGEQMGGCNALWGKNTNTDRSAVIEKAAAASAISRREKSKNNPKNIFFWQFVTNIETKTGRITDFDSLSNELNSLGQTTSTGMEFTPLRARAMYNKLLNIYRYENI